MIAWIAVVAYFAVTSALALRARRRATSLASFAVGGRNMPAPIVACAMAAQLGSVATFLVNPGLVYSYGVAALLGYGVSGGCGIIAGFLLFSGAFRRRGAQVEALTVPNWIGARYGSNLLRGVFSVLSLALITKATLLLVALSLLLSAVLDVRPHALSVALAIVVSAGVMLGGAIGHAWATTVHALTKAVVALLFIGAGAPLLFADPDPWTKLRAIDERLVGPVNPESLYFRSFFEVYVCNFLVGMAVVCQPHVLSKALYLRGERELRTFLGIAIGFVVLFTCVLVTGLWARITLTDNLAMDHVMPAWIDRTFGPVARVVVTVGLLSAGLSTLEGILLALSTTFCVDLYPLLVRAPSDATARRLASVGVALVGLVVIALAWWQIDHPTGESVAIFAQYGSYMLLSASLPPLACGMFMPRVGLRSMAAGVVTALATYLMVALLELTPLHNNPAFLATAAILTAAFVIGSVELSIRRTGSGRAYLRRLPPTCSRG